MKKNNPNTPILLREAQGTLPKIYARYDLGRETSKPLQGRLAAAAVPVLNGLGTSMFHANVLCRPVGQADRGRCYGPGQGRGLSRRCLGEKERRRNNHPKDERRH
jgi:hypothetical protein